MPLSTQPKHSGMDAPQKVTHIVSYIMSYHTHKKEIPHVDPLYL